MTTTTISKAVTDAVCATDPKYFWAMDVNKFEGNNFSGEDKIPGGYSALHFAPYSDGYECGNILRGCKKANGSSGA